MRYTNHGAAVRPYLSQSQVFVQNRDFSLPHLHSTPPSEGFPSEYCHDVRYEKTRVAWLLDGEIFFENKFIRFDRMHERDRRTDGQTDGRTDTA